MAYQIDHLTGLVDRMGGYAVAGRRVSESLLTGRPLAVLWIDIDRFHQINYSFGHAGGDQFVREVARRIAALVHQEAAMTLARMAGDEFVLVMPDCDRSAAQQMAGAIAETMVLPIDIEGVRVHPTVSTGIATRAGDEDAIDLLLRADRAKRLAKQQGGNRYLLSGEGDREAGRPLLREELQIEASLHMALEHGGLHLHYQPILRPDGRVDAVEALMRCYVEGASIPPAKLIPVAEKTGLIARLGEWTLSESALMVRRLLDRNYSIKVAVNVSRAQIRNADFLPTLHAAILAAHIPADLLELELTESLFLDASPVVQANLLGAREAGVGLAIDDFGTGYSSLATLKDVPATKVKLDRSFIVVLPQDRKALAVVRAMANLGRELGLQIVAEGVETAAQQACLEAVGIDAMQGYLHTPPLPLEKLLDWLKASDLAHQVSRCQ